MGKYWIAGTVLCLVVAYNGCSGSVGKSTSPTQESSGWRAWSKDSAPNWLGQYFSPTAYVGSDPSVFKEGSTYHLFHTCYALENTAPNNVSAAICHATSSDGRNWTFGPSIDSYFQGVVFRGVNGAWDEEIETAFVQKNGSTFELFYSGYKREVSGNRPPAQLGYATSSNGNTFTRTGSNPFLQPTAQGRDADDLFSAVFFTAQGLLRSIYVGWCVDGYHDGLNCNQTPEIQLLGATRSAGGVWSKEGASVLGTRNDIPWLSHGVAEPAMLLGPDGYYYLFISGGLADDEPRVTGIARSENPFGPWQINPQPIVKPSGEHGKFDSCGTFAPSVILDGDFVRMWYLGLDDCDGTCSSCNFASCGCSPKYGIGYAESRWPLFK